MISRCTALPALPAGMLGAKIETLFAAYRDFPTIASFYQSDSGGVAALFGGRASVLGEWEEAELSAFLSFCGAEEAERENAPLPVGFAAAEHPVLRFCGDTEEIGFSFGGDLAEAYTILCASDAAFCAETDRLLWLSDLQRRISVGRAAAAVQNGAVVLVTALSDTAAVLGAVAARPACRGKHTAQTLVKAAAAHFAAEGKAVYTVAAKASLVRYYAKAGFSPAGSLFLGKRIEKPECTSLDGIGTDMIK